MLRPGRQRAILTEPPLLTVEILSPDDSYTELEERCLDYRQMGVGTMWIIDPRTRTGRVCTGEDWRGTTRLEVPGTPIFADLPSLFSQIDSQAGEAPEA